MDIYYFNITPLRNKFIFERNLSKVSKETSGENCQT